MLQNYHYFNIKLEADTERILYLLNTELMAHAKTFGCLERKTWKLLDVHNWDESEQQTSNVAAYMNESRWPSQRQADEFSQAHSSGEYEKVMAELMSGIEIVQTVRYVDDEG